MQAVCLLWGPFGFRADELAELVGAQRLSITFLYGPRYLAPLRYLVLFLKTMILLLRLRPTIVLAQNPPIFCPLSCLLYCRMTNTKLLVDHHSIWSIKTLGNSPISKLIGVLERFVARSARANTAPHQFWARKLQEMGARDVLVVHDFVERNRYRKDDRIRKKFAETALIAISSHGGHPLERIEVEAAAAGLVESVTLLVTGPLEKLRARLSRRLPPNVKYLGFLKREEYERVKASADFAINITDEPYTLSHVLFEYAASSIPIISSKQEAVEKLFGDSLVYSGSSSVDEVADGIRHLSDEKTRLLYVERIEKKYEELRRVRAEELQRLRRLIPRAGKSPVN